MFRAQACSLIGLLLLASCAAAPLPPPQTVRAPADPALAAPPPTSLKGYLSTGALDGVEILGPPPAEDSPRGIADRQIYQRSRALAGSPRWLQAERDNDLWFGGAVHRFACALGRDIGPASTPAAYRLLQRMELDVRTVSTGPKHLYHRPRPLVGNDAPVCVPRAEWLKTNGSYPSGHSTTGWAWALVLAQIAPQKASDLLAAGREIGQSRVICGVHFQSDVDAGRVLGSAMVARLHADAAFERDLAAGQAELARDRTPAPHCPA